MTPQEADAFLGGAPAAPVMGKMKPEDADAFLGAAPAPLPALTFGSSDVPNMTPEQIDAARNTSVGRIIDAFGMGVGQGFGESPLGIDPNEQRAIQGAVDKKDFIGLSSAIMSGLVFPAAKVFDAAQRGVGGLVGGFQGLAEQTGIETGMPRLGRDIAALPEAFPTGDIPGMGHAAHAPIDLERASAEHVIGQPEAVVRGTAEPITPAVEPEPVRQAPEPVTTPPAVAEPVAPAAPAEPATVEPVPPPATDAHGLARQIAPQTFQEYDDLTAHRDNLREQIAEAQGELQRNAEGQAPGAAEIAQLRERMEDATPRLAKKYQARLDALTPDHDAFLADDFTMGALTRDTPEVAALRQQLMETDYRLRDLAPDVTSAYRDAAARLPPVEEPVADAATAEATASPRQEAVVEPAALAAPAAPEPVPAPAEPTPPRPAVPSIADDVASKLVAAGRPSDEASAAGKLTEAMWQTRADAFEGKRGTAEQMYAAEAPDIRGQGLRSVPAPATPPVKPGFVRFYHGGVEYAGGSRWLTEDKRYAQAYADKASGGSAFLHYVDVPENSAHLANIAKVYEAGPTEPRAPYVHFDAPTEVSSQLKPYRDANTTAPSRAAQREMAQPGKGLQGRIRLTEDGQSVITLMRTADASTYIHENAHGWLEMMARDAVHPDAPQWMRDDMQTVRDYLKQDGDGPITTRGHELWARSFERYLYEGRAPSQALAGVFQKFAGWLRTVYQSVAKLRAPITPAIRDVMDRIVSTEADRKATITPDRAADAVTPAEGARAVDPVAVTSRLADTHEADLASTEPAEAAPVAKVVRTEVDNAADTHGSTDGPAATATGPRPGRRDGATGGGATAPDLFAEPGGGVERPAAGGGAVQPGAVDAGGGGAVAEGAGLPAERGTAPTAGRADQPAAGPGAAAPLAPPPDGLVDKAGNIVLKNLSQPEDVTQVIRDTAAENGDFMDARRGVIPDAAVIDLADAIGMTPADLARRNVGQAFNAEQVMAARKLLVQSAMDVRDAMAKAARGSDADVMAYAEARTRHRMIQEQVSGITAEAGRALRAFRMMGTEGEQVASVNEFLQGATGRTLNQLRREAQAGASLDTAAQVSKFVNDVAKPDGWDMAMEYYINGLISGPATHTTYAIGNALLALWKAGPETGTAAAIGSIRRLFGDGGERVYAGEVGAQMYGIVKGQRDGIQAAWKAAKSGLTTDLPGENAGVAQASFIATQAMPGGAIPGKLGTVVRLPSRGVATIHSYFRSIGYTQSIAQLAYRTAAEEGLAGDAFVRRVADITTNPPAAMMEQARQAATNQTLMNTGGPFTQKLAELTNTRIMGMPILKIIDPFVKIGSNVMREALMERSPLGVLDADIRANLIGRNGPVARDSQIARIAVGSAIGAAGVGLAAEGLATGGGPTDPREAALWRLSGKQPYSIRIGDTWYEAHRLGPLAMVFGVGADMHEMAAQMETHDISHLGSLMVGSLAKNLMNESFMRGPAELMQAVQDPDRYGDRYVRGQLGALLPFSTAEAQVARAIDPYAREARTTMDSIRARIPFVSMGLYPRLDIFGRPMPNLGDLGADGLTSIAESRVNNDPVIKALQNLRIFPGMPERKLSGVELTGAQYNDFAGTAGRMAKMRLDALVNAPGFTALPPGTQIAAVNHAISESRRVAGELVKMRNPQLIIDAMQARRALLTEGRPVH